jgi:hypothetical protein
MGKAANLGEKAEIKSWNATRYCWIGRQDPHYAMQWVSINGAPVEMASSASLDSEPIGRVGNKRAVVPERALTVGRPVYPDSEL